MYQLAEKNLVLENDEGKRSSFPKKSIVLPFQLDGFSLYTDYEFHSDADQLQRCHISSKVSDVDLYAFKNNIESEEYNYELDEEIKSELKVLYKENKIVRFKTDYQLFGANIQIAGDQTQTKISHKQQGFFSILTLNIAVADDVFTSLRKAIINDSLKSVSIDVEVQGFDLGADLGPGYAGIALVNDETAKVKKLSIQQGHRHSTFLHPRLARIEELLEKIAGEDME